MLNLCVNYLISQGIDSARLTAKGWGNSSPLPGCSAADIAKMKDPAAKEAAWQADRRTEFRVTRFDYAPKGGFSHEDSLKMIDPKDIKISGQGAQYDSSKMNQMQDNGGGQTPGRGPNENYNPLEQWHNPIAPRNEVELYKRD